MNRPTYPRLSAFIGGLVLGVSLLLAGCQSEDSTTSDTRKEQEQAMKDPFNYGPNAQDLSKPPGKFDDVDPTDITGGGTSTLDKRALKRDLDSVFNP